MRHLITIADLDVQEIMEIFTITTRLKTEYRQGIRAPLLAGRVMALLFEKQSLRTRVSFEAGMAHLGGSSMMLGSDTGFGKRESTADFARVLSVMVDVIVLRSKMHQTVVDVARHSSCPVINGLTDAFHPCQVLADLYTLQEHIGSLRGSKLAWIGDCNNVARSLALACGKLGVRMAVASPPDYRFTHAFLAELNRSVPELDLTMTEDPQEAVFDASAVYTDVWASMGQESEREQRQRDFADYQINKDLMASAPEDAIFMHCLPARRGEEVTDEVIDGPHSVVVAQAGNRMHVQKGILVWLLC
ncbi:MAG: ornithine carbamoyltransferase [Pirellulales bacterium]|nr:ornithine carbamoyltransferase [Pirellulales bacterium]